MEFNWLTCHTVDDGSEPVRQREDINKYKKIKTNIMSYFTLMVSTILYLHLYDNIERRLDIMMFFIYLQQKRV